MAQTSQLETSLKGFQGVVKRLFDAPSLDEAFEEAQSAWIVSSRLMGTYERKIDSRGTSVEDLRYYNKLIRKCLSKFRVMLESPDLNGQKRHLILYLEQLGGRYTLANRMINQMYPSEN
jgi:hypothetical protein